MTRTEHQKWMQQALELAAKGLQSVSPNPMVGAIVVKNKKNIGQGYHAYYGGAHAEVNALRKAGKQAKGATLYVTLEPCSSWGKTPPCVDAILKAGIRKVVIGATDSNPAHKGRAAKLLRKEGIEVVTGICARAAREQNRAFFKWVTTGLPYVTLKMAQTLDGKIATVKGSSRWITSKPARELVHKLRLEQDAILVGKNTLLADDPHLSPRTNKKSKFSDKPWRIAIDPDLKLKPSARIFKGKQTTLIVCTEKSLKKPAMKKAKGTFLIVNEKRGRLDFEDLLAQLAALGIGKLLVEGGGETAWALLKEGLVDRVLWFAAPKILGGKNAIPSVGGEGFPTLDKAITFKEQNWFTCGPDALFEGTL